MLTLVDGFVDGEQLSLYPLGDSIALVAQPPLAARGYRYGDLVQTSHSADGALVVDRVVRASTARSWRFPHALHVDAVRSLAERCSWLGAAMRATLAEMVVAVPANVDSFPVLQALLDAGVHAVRDVLPQEIVA